jgi:hypothetical protein
MSFQTFKTQLVERLLANDLPFSHWEGHVALIEGSNLGVRLAKVRSNVDNVWNTTFNTSTRWHFAALHLIHQAEIVHILVIPKGILSAMSRGFATQVRLTPRNFLPAQRFHTLSRFEDKFDLILHEHKRRLRDPEFEHPWAQVERRKRAHKLGKIKHKAQREARIDEEQMVQRLRDEGIL